MAAPKPRAKVRSRSTQGVVAPTNVRNPRAPATPSIQPWTTRRSLRRSTTSPIAPEGRPARSMGSEVAVCTSATRVAEEVREVMSQAAATFCIQVPTLDAKAAIHKVLKRGSRSGAHAEEGAAACPLVTRDPQQVALGEDAQRPAGGQRPAGREHYGWERSASRTTLT
jgi:hypothetical protein